MAVMNDVNEVLHKIEAKLYPNYLGHGGPWVARSKSEQSLSIENVCASAKNRGGFSGQYSDLVEHARVFVDEMIYQLLDGFSVQVGPYFSLHTHLGGTYESERDHIPSSKVSVGFHESGGLKELISKVEVVNEGLAGDGAFIDVVTDARSGTINHALSPGGALTIAGHKIKVEGADPAVVGVWFVNKAGGSRTKVTENLVANHPAEVIAIIPALPAGTYTAGDCNAVDRWQGSLEGTPYHHRRAGIKCGLMDAPTLGVGITSN